LPPKKWLLKKRDGKFYIFYFLHRVKNYFLNFSFWFLLPNSLKVMIIKKSRQIISGRVKMAATHSLVILFPLVILTLLPVPIEYINPSSADL
jgi:hypothetical protein